MAEAASHSIASDQGLSAPGARSGDGDAPAGSTDELASSVDALLSQIEESCERVQQELAGASAPAPASEAATDAIAETPTSTHGSAPAQAEPAAAPKPEPASAEIGSLDAELSRLAESMLSEPEFGGAPPAAEREPEPSSPDRVDDIDAAAGVAAAPAPPPAPPPPAVAPKAPPQPAAEVAPERTSDDTAGLGLDVEARPRVGVGAMVAGVARRAAELASAPLNGKPRVVRDSVGWAAVCTMFMAGCLWTAVLLRSPYTPVAATEPTALDQPGASHSGGDNGGHGGGHDGGNGRGTAHAAETEKPAASAAIRHESPLGGSKASSAGSKPAGGKDAKRSESKGQKAATAEHGAGAGADHKPEHH